MGGKKVVSMCRERLVWSRRTVMISKIIRGVLVERIQIIEDILMMNRSRPYNRETPRFESRPYF